MADVDVHVRAEPGSCRELASWLSHLARVLVDAGTAVIRGGSSSESFWDGSAAVAFRQRTARCASDVGEVEQAADSMRSGLDLFADDIVTVRSRMNQCLDIAAESNLVVLGSVIHEPSGDLAAMNPQGAGGDMPALQPKSEEHAEAKRKLEAFCEIESVAADARRLERTAHRSLLKALDGSNSLIEALTSPQTWIARGFVYAGSAHGAATTLAQNARAMNEFAQNWSRLAVDSALSAAARETHMARLLANVGMEANASHSNARLLAHAGTTSAGKLVLGRLTGTLGGQGEGAARSVGKAFSVTGVVASTWFTGKDIAAGKPIDKSVWANFGGLAASTAASSGVSAVASDVGVAGGPVTVASLGVGFGVATAWSYFQDNDVRDLYRDLGGDHIDSPEDQSDEYRRGRFGR